MTDMDDYASLTKNEEKIAMEDGPAVHPDPSPDPPAYSPGTTAAVPQMETKHTVSAMTHQPQQLPYGHRQTAEVSTSAADRMYAISICWCVVCCLCGSPLTLACFIPAILLSGKVRYLTSPPIVRSYLRCYKASLYVAS